MLESWKPVFNLFNISNSQGVLPLTLNNIFFSIKISKNKKHQYKISAFSPNIPINDDKYESNISNNYENYLNSFMNKI